MRYVIVGNGVAGTKAAETIRKRDPQGEIVILSDEKVPFYRRPSLVEHLLGRVPLESLPGRPAGFYQELDIDLRLGNPVIGLDPRARQLTLADGQVLDYDRLLLAVGVRHLSGSIPGDDLEGIHSLRFLADLAALSDRPARARNAVIVGEGVVGLEMARALLSLGYSVTYLLRGSRFWPKVLSPDASTLVEQRLRSEGVDVQPGEAVVAFEGVGGRVRAVCTASGKEIPCHVAGVVTWTRPPLSWAREAGLEVEKRVSVDDFLATNLAGVYAAGDAARLSGEVVACGWLRAWHQGVVAAVNMTGREAPYRRRTVSLSTRVFGMPILVMGTPNPPGAKVRRERGDYPMHGVHKELVIDELGRVVGAVMVGDVSEATRVEDLVQQRVLYSQIEPELLRRLFDLHYWAAAGDEFLCPVCKFLMHIDEEQGRQGRVTCPICGAEFALRQTGEGGFAIAD